jgi:2-methylcitrate dehydratase PrpD
MEGGENNALWADLGQRWRILELYFKPEPICRWAQPATEAARQLRAGHQFDPARIKHIRIETFDAAVQLGSRMPRTTEEAQYAIGFPVAVAFHKGKNGAADVTDDGLQEATITELCSKIELIERPDFTARFPRERVAAVSISLDDGRLLSSGNTTARGDPELPLTGREIADKFDDMASGLTLQRRKRIADAIAALPGGNGAMAELLDAVLAKI